MADYLSNNTPRLKVLYTGPRGTHHMLFRFPVLGAIGGAITAVRSICTAFGPLMLESSFQSAEFAEPGSDIFFPADWGAAINVGSNLAETLNRNPYGAYINFTGRTAAASRVSFYLFNVQMKCLTANNRLTAAEEPDVGNILAAFAAVSSSLCGIDLNTFTLKNYANSGINDNVAKKARSLV